MHHHALGTVFVQRLDDAAQVQPVVLHPEDAHATHAVQRLQDDVTVRGVEGADGLGAARHQRGAAELRELHDGQLFRVVAQGPRLVKYLGPFALGLLQQVGGVEKLRIKRRVFAHDDGAKVLERARAARKQRLGDAEPGGLVTCKADIPHLRRHHRTGLPLQILRLAGRNRVAAPLRLAHHHKGGVLVDFERFQGVGNEEDVHGAR